MQNNRYGYKIIAIIIVLIMIAAGACGKTGPEEAEGTATPVTTAATTVTSATEAPETEETLESETEEPESTDEATTEPQSETRTETGSSAESTENSSETEEAETETETAESYKVETETGEVEVGVKDGVLTFVDAHDNIYEVDVNEDWPANDYDPQAFVMQAFTTPKDMRMIYDSDEYDYRLGIDVYGEHGGIDFWAVDYVGYDFVIVRGGYRGYLYPNLVLDERVLEYVGGALEYGLDVGVYFFSQAISEEEAEEEAQFIIDALEEEGYGPDDLAMGIIYDPESILHAEARTDDLTREQITANAIAFCETVKEAGYKPMIYANMLWEAEKLDLGELSEYPVWYADYTGYPQTPYAFEIWQYGHGMAGGVAAQVDLNIQLIPKQGQK